jgi:hypothetical protein
MSAASVDGDASEPLKTRAPIDPKRTRIRHEAPSATCAVT